jgi:hypothetical protein
VRERKSEEEEELVLEGGCRDVEPDVWFLVRLG